MTDKTSGLFISFEGNEGAGKTTQINILKEKLSSIYGENVVFVHEPGGCTISNKIRELLLDKSSTAITKKCELLLFEAARAQLCETVIGPALQAGKLVIADRFADSSTVYQGYTRGLGEDVTDALNQFSIAEPARMPDATIYLMSNPSVSVMRKGNDTNRLDILENSFYNAVEEGYTHLYQKDNQNRIIPISNRTIAKTTDIILYVLDALFAKHGMPRIPNMESIDLPALSIEEMNQSIFRDIMLHKIDH